MDGVILFVDDQINEYEIEDNKIKRTLENELFEELRKEFPVLGVKNLELAEEAIKSIGSFSAIILDWIFDEKYLLLKPGEDEESLKGIVLPDSESRTLEFLRRNDFYSLIYIFSNEDVKQKFGSELNQKYRKRIKFRKKRNLQNQAKQISSDLIKWKRNNQNLSVPSIWTKTINQSVQKILLELSDADENWVHELGNTAQNDGASGELFIIEILQFLLAESLVQDQNLINEIKKNISNDGQEVPQTDEKSVARLFRRLFYTKLYEDAPIMTGDICKINRNKYGIIITPECDIKDVIEDNNKKFDLLTFSRKSFDEFLSQAANYNYTRNLFNDWINTGKGKDKLGKLRSRFNQNDVKYHILPSFPFNKTKFNLSIIIDFSRGCEKFSFEQIKNKRPYKLNSPFIQQLRQRYISHLGRVGVPSLPESLRNFNLNL